MSQPRIMMISSEATPWAKSGGLADVLGALPAALTALGHAVSIVIPRYMKALTAPSHRIAERVPIALGAGNSGRNFRFYCTGRPHGRCGPNRRPAFDAELILTFLGSKIKPQGIHEANCRAIDGNELEWAEERERVAAERRPL